MERAAVAADWILTSGTRPAHILPLFYNSSTSSDTSSFPPFPLFNLPVPLITRAFEDFVVYFSTCMLCSVDPVCMDKYTRTLMIV